MFRIFELNFVVDVGLRDVGVLEPAPTLDESSCLCSSGTTTGWLTSFETEFWDGRMVVVVVVRLICSDGNISLFGRTIFLCLYGTREVEGGVSFSLVDGDVVAKVSMALGWNFFAGNKSDRRSSGFVVPESDVFFDLSSTLKCSG